LIHYKRRTSGERVLYILDKRVSMYTTAASRQSPKDTIKKMQIPRRLQTTKVEGRRPGRPSINGYRK